MPRPGHGGRDAVDVGDVVGVVGVVGAPPLIGGRSYYVATNGLISNTGSIGSPWTLPYALAGAGGVIKSGDTVWVRGGAYVGDWDFAVSGLDGRKVTFRNYNSERWILDSTTSATDSPVVSGSNVQVWGFVNQFTASAVRRSTDVAHNGSFSNPLDIGNRWHKSFRVSGHDVEIVNFVIHDTGDGGSDQDVGTAYNNKWYGGLIYHGGWVGPDRGHGHSIYTQNTDPRGKSFIDIASFGFFSSGMKLAGSGASFNLYYTVAGCASMNHGNHVPTFGNQMCIDSEGGGDTRSLGNSTFDASTFGFSSRQAELEAFRFNAAGDPTAHPFSFTNCIVVGLPNFNECERWTITGNKFTLRGLGAGGDRTFAMRFPVGVGNTYGEHTVDSNIVGAVDSSFPYDRFKPAPIGNGTFALAGWRTETGYETTGSLVNALSFSGSDTIYRPNSYESGRGWIYCWNWDAVASLNFDLSSFGLAVGDSYVIHHWYDIFGAPVLSGTYAGLTVALGQTGYVPPPIFGWTETIPESMSPYFNAFLVRKVSSTSLPSAPSGLGATSGGTDRVNLAWTSNSAGSERGFQVEEQVGTFWKVVGVTLAGVTTFQHQGLLPSSAHTYRVRSYGEPGESSASATASATTDAPVVPADIAALVTALGGNTVVAAIYDTRAGVTSSAGLISQWDDARGASGFGPSLAQTTGSAQPAWDDVNKLVTTDGISDIMLTVASPVFDTASGKTIVLVGSSAQTPAGYAGVIRDGASTWFGIRTSHPSNYTYEAASSSSTRSVSIAALARRVLIASTTGTTLKVEVPSVAASAGAHTALAAVNRTLAIGGFVSSIFSNTTYRAVIVLAGDYTPAQRDSIDNWAVTNHAAVLA